MKTTVIKDFKHKGQLSKFDEVIFEFDLKENSVLFGNKVSKITAINYSDEKKLTQFEISEGIKNDERRIFLKTVINISTSKEIEEIRYIEYISKDIEKSLSLQLKKGFKELLFKKTKYGDLEGEFTINKDGEYIKYENNQGYKRLPKRRYFREDDTEITLLSSFPDIYINRMKEVYIAYNIMSRINGFFSNDYFIPNIKLY